MALHKTRELVTEGTPQPGDLLIIPRLTLNSGVDSRQLLQRTLERMDLDGLVERGLRVLVLEQDLDNLFGINTEERRPRHSFIAAQGHPVFAGLRDSDLALWSGASDLVPGRTAYGADETRFPERMWHVSNTNSVATRTMIRPQTGSVRALAVSGFDLQESPLLEVARGRGRMIFCQYDLSSRYGSDPAATRLLDNLLAYLATAPEPKPTGAGVQVVDEDVARQAQVFRAAVPTGEAGWGIVQGDLFNREAIYDDNQPTRSLPAGELPVFAGAGDDGYPQVVRPTEDGFETTLHPGLFTTGWMQRKVRWLHAALRINAGVGSTQGPALGQHGRRTALYPVEWVEGFVHPYTPNIW